MRKMLKFIKWFKERSSLAFRWWLSKQAKTSVICWFFPNLRSKIWKYCGVNIGKHVSIGWDVFLDVRYARFLTIEDDVWITNRAIVFCHKRIMTDYHEGIRYKTLPQLPRETVIKKGALISTGAMVMPGVTVGEGAIVGAGALVAKDVPAWSLAVGVPAKVVKKFE